MVTNQENFLLIIVLFCLNRWRLIGGWKRTTKTGHWRNSTANHEHNRSKFGRSSGEKTHIKLPQNETCFIFCAMRN